MEAISATALFLHALSHRKGGNHGDDAILDLKQGC
jgi:hypothetical protein